MKIMKKLLSIVLCLAMIMATRIPLVVQAAPADGSIPISNRADLQKIGNDKNYPLSGSYYLTANIDLSAGAWIPIDNFSGIFDGQGQVISGLTVIDDAGLFRTTSADAIIKNLGIENVDVSYNESNISLPDLLVVGGICGTNNGLITNCYTTGTVKAITTTFRVSSYAGGICGFNTGTITNCYSSCSTIASAVAIWSKAYAGAICGINSGGSISFCLGIGSTTAKGDYYGDYNGGSYAGGVCGYSEDNSTVSKSFWYRDCVQTVNDTQLSESERKGLGYGIGQANVLDNAQMQQQASFSDWDFTDTWIFIPNVNSDYPVLRVFYSLPSSWAETGVNDAIAKGFVPKDLQDKYQNTITRAEFCRMTVNWLEYALGKGIDTILLEKGVSRDSSAFTDTSDPDILAAFALGITNGTGNNQFTPDGQFSREQAATMIMNTCKVIGVDVSYSPASGFTDMNLASSWAVDGINFVRANGIMQGTGNNNFSPKATYTREQSIVTFDNIDYNALLGR